MSSAAHIVAENLCRRPYSADWEAFRSWLRRSAEEKEGGGGGKRRMVLICGREWEERVGNEKDVRDVQVIVQAEIAPFLSAKSARS